MEEQTTSPSQSSSPKKSGSVFEIMPPKFAFWAGIVAATAVISLIGFITMLVLMLTDDGSTSKTKVNANANTNAAAAADEGSTVSGTVGDEYLRNVKGKGDLTIVEFSDLDCPYCKQFHPTLQQIAKEYDGKVRWAYNHFPLNIHPGAQLAAEASECAGAQGKFWEFIDNHFGGTGTNKTADQHADDAAKLGMNRDKFKSCLDDKSTTETVTKDATFAQQLGAQGTPFAVIIDKDGTIVGSIPGALPYAQVKSTVEGLLN